MDHDRKCRRCKKNAYCWSNILYEMPFFGNIKYYFYSFISHGTIYKEDYMHEIFKFLHYLIENLWLHTLEWTQKVI